MAPGWRNTGKHAKWILKRDMTWLVQDGTPESNGTGGTDKGHAYPRWHVAEKIKKGQDCRASREDKRWGPAGRQGKDWMRGEGR